MLLEHENSDCNKLRATDKNTFKKKFYRENCLESKPKLCPCTV